MAEPGPQAQGIPAPNPLHPHPDLPGLQAPQQPAQPAHSGYSICHSLVYHLPTQFSMGLTSATQY